MEERQQAGLEKTAAEGAAIRQMCETPGFKILREKFDEKVRKATARLLDANTPEKEVMDLRRKIQVWTEVTNMLKSLMLTGQYAFKVLDEEKQFESTNTPA